MIKENDSPAMYGYTPPQSDDDAATRVSELLCCGNVTERFIYVVFHSMEQMIKGFGDNRYIITKSKKPVGNSLSMTHFLNMTCQDDLAEYSMIVNETDSLVRILNIILTSEPKIKPLTKIVNCIACGQPTEIRG